jgi:hypothetical protein
MTKKRILLFDDDQQRASSWAAKLRKLPVVKRSFDVQVMPLDEFEWTFTILDDRRRKARDGKDSTSWDKSVELDTTAILMIDYDLFKLNSISYITGETVAYLARCYSRCGLIVALNAYGKNPFDLTLKGHPESFADLNLGDFQISNSGLWGEPWTGFRPWVWPVLPKALAAYKKRVDEVSAHLAKPVLEFLGLERFAPIFPRSTLEFIESKIRKPEETTFEDFVKNSRQGLRPGDMPASNEFTARIAAARIHKWLERLVLPGQDLLVDAPHLVDRFPSLLRGNSKRPTAWKRIATLELPNEGMKTEVIDQFRFTKENWVSRPCWYWGDVSGFEGIDEVGDPWKAIDKVDLVFCEDLSSFAPREDSKEFVADLASPFLRRYVNGNVAGVTYQPAVRFAM